MLSAIRSEAISRNAVPVSKEGASVAFIYFARHADRSARSQEVAHDRRASRRDSHDEQNLETAGPNSRRFPVIIAFAVAARALEQFRPFLRCHSSTTYIPAATVIRIQPYSRSRSRRVASLGEHDDAGLFIRGNQGAAIFDDIGLAGALAQLEHDDRLSMLALDRIGHTEDGIGITGDASASIRCSTPDVRPRTATSNSIPKLRFVIDAHIDRVLD